MSSRFGLSGSAVDSRCTSIRGVLHGDGDRIMREVLEGILPAGEEYELGICAVWDGARSAQ